MIEVIISLIGVAMLVLAYALGHYHGQEACTKQFYKRATAMQIALLRARTTAHWAASKGNEHALTVLKQINEVLNDA